MNVKMTQEQTKEQELRKIKWAAKMQAKYSEYSEVNPDETIDEQK